MTAPRARRAARLAVLALASCVLAAPASAQRVTNRLDDLRLATAVRLALVEDARTRSLDVTVTARDGGVEVSGEVPAADRPLVAEVARAVSGVRVVGGLGAAGDRTAPTPIRPRAAEAPVAASERVPERSASGPLYHTVERGDTLFSLARRYDTTVEVIQALNGRASDGIRVGQRLRVR